MNSAFLTEKGNVHWASTGGQRKVVNYTLSELIENKYTQ